MALKSGTYIIANKAEDSYVGRNPIEDKSLHPKRVVVLPQGVEAPKWEIKALDDESDNYILKIGGGDAAEIDKLLFAVLIDTPEQAIWKIVPQPREGKNTYIIVLAERPYEGWFVPHDKEGEEKQIAVLPLPATKSLPPIYLPASLFIITPLE